MTRAPSRPRVAPRADPRDLILGAAVEHLAKRGPAGVHPKEICEENGLSKALVNYHFGGRDGLVAEAMALGYERYVDVLWKAAVKAGPHPFDKLMAWVDRQVEWTRRNPGLAAALDFPHHAASTPTKLSPDVAGRLEAAGTKNFANLTTLVGDARRALRGKASRSGARRGAAIEDEDLRTGLDAAVIGWTTLGLSVWLAGNHAPTRGGGARRSRDRALPLARDRVRRIFRGILSA